jgi:hypothetical protein
VYALVQGVGPHGDRRTVVASMIGFGTVVEHAQKTKLVLLLWFLNLSFWDRNNKVMD